MVGQDAMPSALDWAAYEKLCAALCRQPIALAFSGGFDSRFLAFTAQQAGAELVLFHAVGPHTAPQEHEYAEYWAKKQNMPLKIVDFDPLMLEGVKDNSRERCYACKQALFAQLQAKLVAEGYGTHRLCDGTHAGDLLVWRPGLRALQEAGVWSPLAYAGLDKSALRRLARSCGMDKPEQQARPCLLTRLAYGMRPHAALLLRLAKAEDAVAKVLAQMHAENVDFRLRLTPTVVLQTTLLTQAQRTAALAELHTQGFAPVTVQEEERISGFFDR